MEPYASTFTIDVLHLFRNKNAKEIAIPIPLQIT